MKKEEPKPVLDWKPWAGLAARAAVGAILIFSGLQKLIHAPEEFAAIIISYQFFQPEEALNLARKVPWVELFLGLYVLAGNMTGAAAAGAGALFISFIILLGRAMNMGIKLENCGCFGAALHLTSAQALAVDSLLLCLAVVAYSYGGKLFSVDKWVSQAKQ
jgi:uncharacterized membrane protein YphA (DoxX/SURF4 family)